MSSTSVHIYIFTFTHPLAFAVVPLSHQTLIYRDNCFLDLMGRRWTAIFLFAFVLLSRGSASAEHGGAAAGWLMPAVRSGCRGTVAECFESEEEEFELDSESNRRILATRRYVSYGALQRNTIPCSRRGAAYYNCRPGAAANPYTRGCTAVTRCRS